MKVSQKPFSSEAIVSKGKEAILPSRGELKAEKVRRSYRLLTSSTHLELNGELGMSQSDSTHWQLLAAGDREMELCYQSIACARCSCPGPQPLAAKSLISLQILAAGPAWDPYPGRGRHRSTTGGPAFGQGEGPTHICKK